MMIRMQLCRLAVVPVLAMMALGFQAGCAGSPKKVVYTPVEYEAEVRRRLVDHLPTPSVSYHGFLEPGRGAYTLEVEPLRPPFLLGSGDAERIDGCVGRTGGDRLRLAQLRDCVINRPEKIHYNGTLTLDAPGCLELREGNCFALTNLFVGAARHSGLRAWYVMVEDVITNRSAGAQVFHINHIVCGVMVNSGQQLVDFIPDPRDYHVITTLSDIEAAGLYYNNLGANLMLSGRNHEAGQLLEMARRLYPDSYQVQNNLGLLHRRLGDLEAAQVHFEQAFALARFPDLIMGNLLQLYRETGQAEKMEDLRRTLSQVSRRNPYLYVALAREAVLEEDHERALDYLAIARRINRRIPAIYALECEIWEVLEKPRRFKRARKKLGRLLDLEDSAVNPSA